MRLICPDCNAQYEVPDDVIPANGRDVQCSSCNRTWYALPAQVVEPKTRTDTVDAEPVATPAPGLNDAQDDEIPPPRVNDAQDEEIPAQTQEAEQELSYDEADGAAPNGAEPKPAVEVPAPSPKSEDPKEGPQETPDAEGTEDATVKAEAPSEDSTDTETPPEPLDHKPLETEADQDTPSVDPQTETVSSPAPDTAEPSATSEGASNVDEAAPDRIASEAKDSQAEPEPEPETKAADLEAEPAGRDDPNDGEADTGANTPEPKEEQDPLPSAFRAAPVAEDTRATVQVERKPIDSEVAAILREEAERERQRRAGALGVDSKSGEEANLSPEAQDTLFAERPARENPTAFEPLTPAAKTTQKLPFGRPSAPEKPAQTQGFELPHRDPINDTPEFEGDFLPKADIRRKPRFRRGFLWAILLAVFAWILTLLAPFVSQNFPALAPFVETYLDGFAAVQTWLVSQWDQILSWVTSLQNSR